MFPEAIGVVANFMNGWDTQQGMILLAPLSAGHWHFSYFSLNGTKMTFVFSKPSILPILEMIHDDPENFPIKTVGVFQLATLNYR